jgi:hypothetical protein
LPIAQATCRGPAFTLRRVPMAQNDSGQPTLLSSTTAREQARAAGCLQRISLPGRRDKRRPKRGSVKGFTAKLRGLRIFYGAPPACRSCIPQNLTCQSGRGGLGLRPVGGHPADHPLFFLLLLALMLQVSLRTWQVCLRKGERRGWEMPPDLVPTVDPLKNHHWVNVA